MNCKVRKWMLILVTVAALLMAPLSALADSPVDTAGTPPKFSPAQADGVIEGYVTDGDGTGLYNAYVNAYGPSSTQTSTDNEGYYSFSGLVGGSYTVTAYPPDESSLVLYCATAEVVGGETTALDFVLPAGGGIAGRVTDEHGAGVYNAYVYASGAGFGSGETSTDNEGYYSVVGLMSDSYDVWVSPPSGANLLQGVTTVQVTQGDTTGPLNFVLPPGGIIAGRVTDEHGAGVYNAGVEANGPGSGWASTDNQGYYSIIALQPSAGYTVTASPPDEVDLLQSTATGIAVEAVTTTTVNFVLLAPVQGTIAGRVTDNYGVAVSGLQVYASGPVWREDYTDSSGNYSIDGLEIGSYNVTAYPYPSVNLVSSTATGVVVPADNTTTTQDFVLQAGGIITGQVTDGEEGVYLAYVHAYSSANRGAYTDNAGNYSIVGLPTGSYYVEVTCSGGNLLPVSATPAVIQGAPTTQNFVLPAGGIIQGHVTDEDGPVYMALVWASGPRNGYAYTDNVGNYSIDGLRTGSYSVAAYPPAGSVSAHR
jgi:protocatechuate 3,4-dioxygenase beta subunit